MRGTVAQLPVRASDGDRRAIDTGVFKRIRESGVWLGRSGFVQIQPLQHVFDRGQFQLNGEIRDYCMFSTLQYGYYFALAAAVFASGVRVMDAAELQTIDSSEVISSAVLEVNDQLKKQLF